MAESFVPCLYRHAGVVSHAVANAVVALQLHCWVTIHIVLATLPFRQEARFPTLHAVHRADALDGAHGIHDTGKHP